MQRQLLLSLPLHLVHLAQLPQPLLTCRRQDPVQTPVHRQYGFFFYLNVDPSPQKVL